MLWDRFASANAATSLRSSRSSTSSYSWSLHRHCALTPALPSICHNQHPQAATTRARPAAVASAAPINDATSLQACARFPIAFASLPTSLPRRLHLYQWHDRAASTRACRCDLRRASVRDPSYIEEYPLRSRRSWDFRQHRCQFQLLSSERSIDVEENDQRRNPQRRSDFGPLRPPARESATMAYVSRAMQRCCGTSIATSFSTSGSTASAFAISAALAAQLARFGGRRSNVA